MFKQLLNLILFGRQDMKNKSKKRSRHTAKVVRKESRTKTQKSLIEPPQAPFETAVDKQPVVPVNTKPIDVENIVFFNTGLKTTDSASLIKETKAEATPVYSGGYSSPNSGSSSNSSSGGSSDSGGSD